jgi:two-component system response regulator GlrR
MTTDEVLAPHRTRRILIADDDPRVLLVLRATLRRMKKKHQIVAVRDGTEALAEIEDEPFDLVITDVRMPGIDGVTLAEEIRALNLERSTEVIWITAYGCQSLQAEAERLRVHRCLDKPLRIGEIRQAARDALGEGLDPEKINE